MSRFERFFADLGRRRVPAGRRLASPTLLATAALLALVAPAWAAHGALDPTWGGSGKVVTASGRLDVRGGVGGLVRLTDGSGRIVAAGGNGAFWLARYRPNGTLDPTFNGDGNADGLIFTEFAGACCEGINAILQQRDGRLVAAGFANFPFPKGETVALVRYNPNGSLDSTFTDGVSGPGRVVTDVSDVDSAGAHAAHFNSLDGTITVAGDGFLIRYTSRGRLDSRFGSGGIVSSSALDNRGLVIQNAGSPTPGSATLVQKYVATGGACPKGNCARGFTEGREFGLERRAYSGARDTSFGSGGIVFTDFALSSGELPNAIVRQSDGRYVAAGEALAAPGASMFALARYSSGGTLDTTFGLRGTVLTDFPPSSSEGANALVYSSTDGTLTTAGSASVVGSHLQFALARHSANGVLDPSFDLDGMVLTDFGSDAVANALLMQPDGSLFAGGEVKSGVAGRFAVAKYHGTRADKTPPRVGAGLRPGTRLREVLRTRRLPLRLASNEPAVARLTVTFRRSGRGKRSRRRITLASGRAKFLSEGLLAQSLKVKVAGRRVLADRRRARVRVTIRARDSVGNRGTRTVKLVLRG